MIQHDDNKVWIKKGRKSQRNLMWPNCLSQVTLQAQTKTIINEEWVSHKICFSTRQKLSETEIQLKK